MVERQLPKLHTRVRFPSPAHSRRASLFVPIGETERVVRREPTGMLDESDPLDCAAILGWNGIKTNQASASPNEFEKLLPLDLPYVALLGPRRRRDQLLHVLLDAGLTVRSKLFAPAGLDIGAESPEEIAFAIVAEVQATFADGSANSPRDRKAPIHLARKLEPVLA